MPIGWRASDISISYTAVNNAPALNGLTPYRGGPVIERLAREGNPKSVRFSVPRMGDGRPDFSFSGLKTAVSKHVRETGLQPVADGEEPTQAVKDLAASFQSVVVRSLVSTMWCLWSAMCFFSMQASNLSRLSSIAANWAGSP